MTVEELIARLREEPPERNVYFYNGHCCEIVTAPIVKVWMDAPGLDDFGDEGAVFIMAESEDDD